MLETSPRLGVTYAERMRSLVEYVASDYDESAHSASLQLDLQSIDLPDASLDIVLTPHVLEHVPDTARALAELHRVVAAQGNVFLQVPVLHGRTRVPSKPEYHGDNTLVYHRFGWDLIEMIERAGFACDVLVPETLLDAVVSGVVPPFESDDADVQDLICSIDPERLTVVASRDEAARHGFAPPFHFITFACRKSPAPAEGEHR